MSITITAKRNTLLKKEPLQGRELESDAKVSVQKGKTYEVLSMEEAKNDHVKVVLGHEAGTWYVYQPHWSFPSSFKEEASQVFTKENLRSIMPLASSRDISTYVEPLNLVANKFDILTSKRAAAFIAQLAHESGSLRYKEEIASGEAYEGRSDLGNTQEGDGKRYKGRGLIQLTGRSNYRQAGEALGLPLEEKPETVVSDPYVNALVAGWFWHTRGLNALADKEDFVGITRRINGGTNGLEDRMSYWRRAKDTLYSNNSSVDWGNPSAKISKFFTVREVTLGHLERLPKDLEHRERIISLAKELDKLREEWGGPILVTSWYRPPSVNRRVGGVPNSQHLNGCAVDIRPANGKLESFQEFCDKHWYGALGYGANKGFVHLDMRNGKGWRSGGSKGVRWNY